MCQGALRKRWTLSDSRLSQILTDKTCMITKSRNADPIEFRLSLNSIGMLFGWDHGRQIGVKAFPRQTVSVNLALLLEI